MDIHTISEIQEQNVYCYHSKSLQLGKRVPVRRSVVTLILNLDSGVRVDIREDEGLRIFILTTYFTIVIVK